jgi:DNA polymerase-3 subunit delta'
MIGWPTYPGEMTDVFDRLVGQDRAVASLRQYALNPVHAYLFSGPSGSSVHDALVVFAAALQCPNKGCGECEICRLVLSEQDPDVHFAERSGVSWRMEEIREAERVSRRRPLGLGYQIVVIEDVELTTTGASPSAPALLKSLEEPPPRTIFLLSAEALPGELDTIVSRCVDVKLRSLSEDDLESILIGDGTPSEVARSAAQAANGNLRRARVLVRDADLASRVEQWRSVPERLSGTPSGAALVVQELGQSLDEAITPLQQLQEEEMERRASDAREMGLRAVANRKDVEAQFKREQRRFRLDELRFGFSALTGVYRDRLIENLEDVANGDPRSEYRVGASLRAIDAVTEANRRLTTNIDESLLLHDLMFSLMEF